MDITQILVTAGAVLGIILVALLAIVPTVLELPGRSDPEPVTPPTPLHDRRRSFRPHRHHHDLAA